jgi:hypothetical protein
MSTWTNEDGLLVKFGPTRSEVRDDGHTSGERRQLVVDLPDATALTDAADANPVSDEVASIPANAVILNSWFEVDTAFTSGGSAVLDIGLKQEDGTVDADDGLDNIAVATLTADAVVANDGTLIPSKAAYKRFVVFSYDTAVFTAGAGSLVIDYIAV